MYKYVENKNKKNVLMKNDNSIRKHLFPLPAP